MLDMTLVMALSQVFARARVRVCVAAKPHLFHVYPICTQLTRGASSEPSQITRGVGSHGVWGHGVLLLQLSARADQGAAYRPQHRALALLTTWHAAHHPHLTRLPLLFLAWGINAAAAAAAEAAVVAVEAAPQENVASATPTPSPRQTQASWSIQKCQPKRSRTARWEAGAPETARSPSTAKMQHLKTPRKCSPPNSTP